MATRRGRQKRTNKRRQFMCEKQCGKILERAQLMKSRYLKAKLDAAHVQQTTCVYVWNMILIGWKIYAIFMHFSSRRASWNPFTSADYAQMCQPNTPFARKTHAIFYSNVAVMSLCFVRVRYSYIIIRQKRWNRQKNNAKFESLF